MAAAGVGLALALTACATSTGGSSSGDGGGHGSIKAGPGIDVENKTITLGDIAALTGPAAALSEPGNRGWEVFWQGSNARDELDGWTVEIITRDSGYQPQQHVQIFNELKSEVALIGSFGSPTTKAILPLVERENILTVPEAFDSLWGTKPVLAPLSTPYAIDALNSLGYLTDQGKKKLKVGAIYQNDEYGADGLRGYEAAFKEYGFTDVGREPFKAGDTDFTAQVQKLKSAGAEVVFVVALASAAGPIVGTSASMGFTPQFVFLGPAFVENLMTADGSADGQPTPIAKALTGTIVTSFAAPWGDESVPGMEQMLLDVEKFAPEQNPSVYFTVGYAQSKMVQAVLKNAIADGDLSREGIVNAKNSLGEVPLEGLVPSTTYDGEVGPPSRASLIERIDPEVVGFLTTVEAGYLSEPAKTFDIE